MTTPTDHVGSASCGTASRYRYTVKGCRCVACTTANATYQKDYLRRRRSKGLVDQHGKRLQGKPDGASDPFS